MPLPGPARLPPRPRFTIPMLSDGASERCVKPSASTGHTPPCSHAGFSRTMNNLEAPSINTRSGMPGAHSIRQPPRRAEKPHHELHRGLRGDGTAAGDRREPPPESAPSRPRRAAAAAAVAVTAARRRRPAARRRRLVRGGRAGGGGGGATGAARLRVAGLAAAQPRRPAAGRGGYGAAAGDLRAAPGARTRRQLSVSLRRCARSSPSARTAWRCSSGTTSTCPRWRRRTAACSPALTRQGTAPLLPWAAFGPIRAPLNSAQRARHPELLLMFSLLSPQEKCLRKLSSGLFAFQTYLEFIQETFASEKQNVESLCYGTKHLAATIRQMVSRCAGHCRGRWDMQWCAVRTCPRLSISRCYLSHQQQVLAACAAFPYD